MLSDKTFQKAWFLWRRMLAPVSNFRQGRVNSPTYNIELELDHLISYVYTLGGKAISGESLDYASLAKEELIELEKISGELGTCEISDLDKATFVEYVDSTREVLEALSKFSLNQ
jgi:hypothetical protein